MKIFEHKLFSNKLDLVGLIFFFMLAVLPLLLGIGYALLYSNGAIGALSEGLTLSHWKEVLQNSEVLYSFGFSTYIAFMSIGIAITLALIGTLLFNKQIEKGFFSYIVYLPLAIPGIVAALFILQLFSGAGFLSRLSFQLGLIDSIREFPSLVNDQWGIGIITAMVMLATPFFMIYFQNIYKSERLDELSQLATTLGSKKIITSLGSYEIPLLLGQESPQMVSVLTIRKLRRFNLLDIPEAYIIAILYIIIVLSVVLYLFKKRRLSYDL